MGCLNVHISVIETPTPQMSIDVVGKPLIVALGIIGESIRASVSELCNIPQDFFLRVSPDVVWLTPDNDFEGVFNVKSNTKWEVIGGIEEEDYITTLTNDMLISNDILLANYNKE